MLGDYDVFREIRMAQDDLWSARRAFEALKVKDYDRALTLQRAKRLVDLLAKEFRLKFFVVHGEKK